MPTAAMTALDVRPADVRAVRRALEVAWLDHLVSDVVRGHQAIYVRLHTPDGGTYHLGDDPAVALEVASVLQESWPASWPTYAGEVLVRLPPPRRRISSSWE